MEYLQYEETPQKFREAVRLYADRHDNKTLEILLKNFNISTVAKLIRLFSNQNIKIPDSRKIWMVYRNKRIREEMDSVDPFDKRAVREKKQQLAIFFHMTFGHVDAVWRDEKIRAPGDYDAVNAIAGRIYREEFIHFEKEVDELMKVNDSLLDTTRKVPIIPY